jgi:hypothetical protein
MSGLAGTLVDQELTLTTHSISVEQPGIHFRHLRTGNYLGQQSLEFTLNVEIVGFNIW